MLASPFKVGTKRNGESFAMNKLVIHFALLLLGVTAPLRDAQAATPSKPNVLSAGNIDQRGWTEFFLRSKAQRQTGWPLNSWSEEVPFPDPFPNSIYNKGREVIGGLFLEWGAIPNEREEQIVDTIWANYAVSKLKEKHDQPFFLGVGFYAPHFPNYCPQKYFDLYDPAKIELPPYKDDDLDDLPEKIRKNKINRMNLHHKRLVELGAVKDAIHGYLACMSYADALIGRILDALDASPHAVTDVSVSLIDMYPTLVERCELPPPHRLEGVSIAATLRDPANAKYRDVYLPHMEPGSYAIMNRDWRYIHYADDTEELYDVQADPNEWFNLASKPEHAATMVRLRARAPKEFAPPATKLNAKKNLVFEGDTFRWEVK
jgi:arylsulfatase A-like enzyme